jgi:hypothetical protein
MHDDPGPSDRSFDPGAEALAGRLATVLLGLSDQGSIVVKQETITDDCVRLIVYGPKHERYAIWVDRITLLPDRLPLRTKAGEEIPS